MKSFRIILPVLFLVLVQPARAGSPSWNLNPSNGDWNTAANWTPATVPNSPTDVATFVISNTTDVSLSANVEVDSIIFDPGASLYTLSVGFPANLTLAGAGIVVSGIANCSSSHAFMPIWCRCASDAGVGPNVACSRKRASASETTGGSFGASVTLALAVADALAAGEAMSVMADDAGITNGAV